MKLKWFKFKKKKKQNEQQAEQPHGSKESGELENSNHFDNFPTEIQQYIVENLDFKSQCTLRQVSRHMQEIVNSVWLHDFEMVVRIHERITSKYSRLSVAQVIKYATEVYVAAGFGDVFCMTVLQKWRAGKRTVANLAELLLTFYTNVENMLGESKAAYCRVLFSISLLQLLKSFPKCKLIPPSKYTVNSCLVLEVEGVWFGRMKCKRKRTRSHAEQRRNLLVVLTTILISPIWKRNFRHMRQFATEAYMFGYERANSKESPSAMLTLKIFAAENIISALLPIFEGSRTPQHVLENWPERSFRVHLEITCRDSIKACTLKQQKIKISM